MKAVLIEFIGTFFFLYVGGSISGGNFNPAVTIMMIAAKKQRLETALPYIVAQVAGGLAALALYKTI